MSKVYFAGPLFCQSEKVYNLKLTELLEHAGYEVFLPQRDGFEAAQLQGKTADDVSRLIFKRDTSAIKEADIFFMVLDGRVPDEGACVELGIAYSSGKRCYGIKTDTRSLELGLTLNPLISGCFTKIFVNQNGDSLVEELKEFLLSSEL